VTLSKSHVHRNSSVIAIKYHEANMVNRSIGKPETAMGRAAARAVYGNLLDHCAAIQNA